MMTYVGTSTETYTVLDISKAFESFEAGLCLIARSTGLWSVEYARDIAADVVTYAVKKYLAEVHIVLSDAGRQPVHVHEYRVSTNASGWTVQRPDGNLWPLTPGGSLTIILKYNAAWAALGAAAQEQFKKGLRSSWGPTSLDITYPGLTVTGTRAYASNAFGLARTARERQ